MAKPIHSMIRVLDETRSVDFYRRAVGMRVADRFAFEGFTLVYLSGETGDFELELTINHGRTESYALGEGYGHIAFVADDLAAEHVRVTAAGLAPTPIREFNRDGGLMAKFFFLQDPTAIGSRCCSVTAAIAERQ
jgi:lactoylglutathione lyase